MPAEVVPANLTPDYPALIHRAAALLSDGKIVILPTETVYGSAGLLNNESSRSRLIAIRAGDPNRPFTLHLADPSDAPQYLGDLSDFARRAIHKLWPGPIGLRFDVPEPRRAEIAQSFHISPPDLFDPQGQITLRCPDHPLAADILAHVKGPVAITAPRAAQKISDLPDLQDQVDLILDAGPTRFSKPSTLVHIGRDSFDIIRPGVYDQRIISRLLQTTLLFVCSGNTCRSPMSEAIARHLLAQKLNVPDDQLESKGINVISAGAAAFPGARATPQGVDALKAMGIDLSRHRSRPLSVELIHQADAIYTMSRAHRDAVLALVPSAKDRTFTLDPAGDIEDPIGADLAVYQNLAKTLTTLITKRLNEKPLA